MEPLSSAEAERVALERLPSEVFAFLADAAGDGAAAGRNVSSLRARALLPRVLRDVSDTETATTLLGERVAAPIGVAPLPRLSRVHSDAERGVARAAAESEVIYCAPTNGSQPLEDLKIGGRRCWFQLYPHRDGAVTTDLADRAQAAGMGALVVTADRPAPGAKGSETSKSRDIADYPNLARHGGDEVVAGRHNPAFTWDDLAALCRRTPLPVVLKGVLNPEDARLAVEHGCAAVWVSNHGGRQLDLAVATVDVLEEVAEAVDGRAEVYIDGGVRRGSDVLVALGLGADAVFLGRPVAFALGAYGTDGVRRLLGGLIAELRQAMALTGARDPRQVARSIVR